MKSILPWGLYARVATHTSQGDLANNNKKIILAKKKKKKIITSYHIVRTQFESQAQESKGSWSKKPNTMNL